MEACRACDDLADGDLEARQKTCHKCGNVFVIHIRCDHGYVCCSVLCGDEDRRLQCCEAQAKYRANPEVQERYAQQQRERRAQAAGEDGGTLRVLEALTGDHNAFAMLVGERAERGRMDPDEAAGMAGLSGGPRAG